MHYLSFDFLPDWNYINNQLGVINIMLSRKAIAGNKFMNQNSTSIKRVFFRKYYLLVIRYLKGGDGIR
jgi:hypothetical protein